MRRLGLAVALSLLLPASAAAAPVFVQSPSGNIGCVVTASGVRCDIRDKEWRPPPKPRSCELDWGFGVTLDRRGKARFVCAGDTVLGTGRKLGYGKSVRRDGFSCRSQRNGMRCMSDSAGRAFLLSRQRVRRFAPSS